MNRSYNFRMPPDLMRRQSMEQLQRMEPVQPYTGLMQPLMAPASATRQLQLLELEPPISSQPMAPMAPASETFGSLEISDPYMRELMRQYYVPPRPVSPLSYQNDTLQNPMVIPMEQAAQPSPYMQDLMRNYVPSMPRVPSMPASFQPAPQTQGNAFFTL